MHRRVVEVGARLTAQIEDVRGLSDQGPECVVEADAGSIRRGHLELAAGQARPVLHEPGVLLDVEELAGPGLGAVDESPYAIPVEPVLGDRTALQPLAPHRFDGVAPDLPDYRSAGRFQ